MGDSVVLEDIMLDDEALGLADELLNLNTPFITVVSSDDSAAVGTEVFFGVNLPVDDIGEVKGSVCNCDKIDEDRFIIEIKVLALDNRYSDMLIRILKNAYPGSNVKEDLVWGTGLRQTNGTFATVINCPAGLLNTQQLEKIAEITKNGAGLAKLTHAQRVILLLKPGQQDHIREELASVDLNIGILHRGVRNIRGCCGALCKWEQGDDTLKLALEIDKMLFGRPAKFDVKIAVSGCSRNCMEAYCVDIGLVGSNRTYSFFVGGVSSSSHFKGLKLISKIPPSDAIQFLIRILEWYENTAQEGERLYKTLERLGRSEAEEKKPLFADAAAVFRGMDIGDDISSRLERTLARSHGLLKMRSDMMLETGNLKFET